MNDRAIKLYGTEEPAPEQRVLTAGPVTATLENGMLRWIKIGEAEVIRAVAFLIRDRNWSTATPEITDLAIDESGGGFKVRFTARCPTLDGAFVWRGAFTGTPDGTVTCSGTGSPEGDGFQTGRTGFVILHPLAGFVGKKLAVEHVDGSVTRARVPAEIIPDQPWLLVRGLTHDPMNGVTATIRMEGDSWETEDHRNWTDASFKTYCRPLALPYPYKIAKGEEVRHTVTLKFSGKLPGKPAAAPGPVTVKLGAAKGRMPAVGLSVLPENSKAALKAAKLVKMAGVQHLNCRIDLRRRGWEKPLGDYARLAKETGAALVLEVIIPGKGKTAAEIGAAAKAVRAAKLRPVAVFVTPAAHLLSDPPGTPFPTGVPSYEELARETRKAFRNVRVGGGMMSNFTELNRTKPPKKTFDFISHATSGLVHAADDRSVMETLESVGYIIGSTQAMIGRTPYRIGPSNIGNSFNPYGADYTANPDNVRVTMARSEPRHRGLFGAAWHLGYLSQAAAGGLEAATVAAPVGDFGIAYAKLDHAQPWFDTAKGAKVYPLYHVIKGLAAAAGAKRVLAESSDTGRVRTVAWRKGKATHVWLANLRPVAVDVNLRGLATGKAQLFLLDETTFEDAARDPAFGDGTRAFKGRSLTLPPFAVARLDIAG
ncbi:MAG: hypothetical protein ABI399_01055 [Bauldia sp.]